MGAGVEALGLFGALLAGGGAGGTAGGGGGGLPPLAGATGRTGAERFIAEAFLDDGEVEEVAAVIGMSFGDDGELLARLEVEGESPGRRGGGGEAREGVAEFVAGAKVRGVMLDERAGEFDDALAGRESLGGLIEGGLAPGVGDVKPGEHGFPAEGRLAGGGLGGVEGKAEKREGFFVVPEAEFGHAFEGEGGGAEAAEIGVRGGGGEEWKEQLFGAGGAIAGGFGLSGEAFEAGGAHEGFGQVSGGAGEEGFDEAPGFVEVGEGFGGGAGVGFEFRDAAEEGGAGAQVIRRRQGGKGEELKCAVVGIEGGAHITFRGGKGAPLGVAEAGPAADEFALKLGVIRGLGGEAREVGEGGLDEEAPGASGAWSVLEGVMNFDEQRAGEAAGFQGVLALVAGVLEGGDGGSGESGKGEGAGEGEGAVAAEELAGAIPDGVLAGTDGKVVEVAAEVVSEFGGGTVAAFRLLVHGVEEDGIEVAREAFAEAGVEDDGAGGVGGLFADGLFDGAWGVVEDAMGFGAGEEFIEDGAERVDIAGDGDGFAADLFGRGVIGGEWRDAGGGIFKIGVEKFADAEVEELDGPGGIDEDIAGFEVTVDDEPAVGVFDGFADIKEEADAGIEGQGFLLDILGNAAAVNIFHDDVGKAVGGGAAIEEAGDVGVLEGSEDLPFSAEALEEEVGIHAGADEFDRDLGVVFVVGAAGEVDRAHATTADFAEEFVGPGAALGGRGLDGEGGGMGDFSLDEALLALLVALEKGFDFAEEGGVVGAGVVEVSGAFGGGQVGGLAEEAFDFAPAVRVDRHGVSVPPR